MKNVLRGIAAEQDGVIAVWQLAGTGLTRDAIAHQTAGLRRLHDGVYITGDAPVTRQQRWWAATLTAPASVLSHASAGAAHQFRPWDGGFEVITRQGSGGPKRFGGLLVCRATTIEQTTLNGLAITTPERTLTDLWPHLNQRAQRKMLREALRLKKTTTQALQTHLHQAPPRRRPAALTRLLARYEHLQLHRCRSDAEAYAVELLAQARLPPPEINVKRAGEEADLSWPTHRLIIEIDGDQYHQDKTEDARKTKAWKAANWRVKRHDSDTVFDRPNVFTTAVRSQL